MNRLARRSALLVLTAVLALALGACTANLGAGGVAFPSVTDAPTVPVTGTDHPASTGPGHGDVEPSFPELSVELVEGYLVSVTDPEAKAWRIAVAGSGGRAGDRLEVIVEVGDIAPGAEVRFERDGQVIDVLELGSMIGANTAASGGCHPSLDVCISSADIAIDPDRGTLTVRLEALGDGPISIQGATAGWPDEPFIRGPWETTEPFVAG